MSDQRGAQTGAPRATGGHGFLIRLLLTAVLIALLYFWPQLADRAPFEIPYSLEIAGRRLVGVLVFFTGASAVSHALRHYFWDGWVQRSVGTDVPKLLIDLSTFAVWVIALILILAYVFDIEVSAFLTTSGIVIAVVGFALRNMISDVFTGIALGFERPFHMGDWIELEDGTLGRVVEMNWRSTKMITKEEVSVVIPNSFLATHPFKNFNHPEDFWRDAIRVVLDYEVTRHQVERVLLSAVSQVPESATLPRAPQVRIIAYTERGVEWELRFWVPNHADQARVRYEVQGKILRNLHYSGIHVPRGKFEIMNANDPMARPDAIRDDTQFLREIGLFRSLQDVELDLIRERMRSRLVIAGDPIVRQGEEGESLFLVKEGYLDVAIQGEGRAGAIEVGHLAPGMFFGEMSLLTGAPRTATVTPAIDSVIYEIHKDDIRPVLQDRPEVVRALSDALAERQVTNDRTVKSLSERRQVQEKQRIADGFFSRIQNFFGIRADRNASGEGAGKPAQPPDEPPAKA